MIAIERIADISPFYMLELEINEVIRYLIYV